MEYFKFNELTTGDSVFILNELPELTIDVYEIDSNVSNGQGEVVLSIDNGQTIRIGESFNESRIYDESGIVFSDVAELANYLSDRMFSYKKALNKIINNELK